MGIAWGFPRMGREMLEERRVILEIWFMAQKTCLFINGYLMVFKIWISEK
jgi:hypothetical protein